MLTSEAGNSASATTSVTGRLAYVAEHEGRTAYRIYPPSTGRGQEGPPQIHHDMQIADCRTATEPLDLDRQGFVMLPDAPSKVSDFFDPGTVQKDYYAEIEALVRRKTGAHKTVAFDYNIRSAERAARGEPGIRLPVDGVHGDYTLESGPRRVRELLEAGGLTGLSMHRSAIINVWRPLRGPVQDVPLAVCDARSVRQADLVNTAIDHFADDDLTAPRHSGEIYSVRHRPGHRWHYVSNMQPDEVLMFKTYDSNPDVARFTPHTGFSNPDCPAAFRPRESIEVRVLVIYP